MDIIALDLGIDPLNFRIKNGLEEGSVSATGETMHSVGFKECLRSVASRNLKKVSGAGYQEFTKARELLQLQPFY